MRQLDEDRIAHPDPGGVRLHGARIFGALAAFAVVAGLTFFFGNSLTWAIVAWFCAATGTVVESCRTVFTSPVDAFLLQLTLAVWAGMLAGWLVASFRFWALYHPGLDAGSARSLLPLDLLSVAGFLAGAAVAVVMVIPSLLGWLVETLMPGAQALDPNNDLFLPATLLQENMKFALSLIVICGIVGQVPFLIAATRRARGLAQQAG